MSYKRIYDSDEIVVDLDGQKLRVSVFEDGHWVGEHFVELPELEPVVHAHWECECEPYCFCSNCRHKFSLFDRIPRCPNCGAHMDEEVAE